jgi:hypothetical protein
MRRSLLATGLALAFAASATAGVGDALPEAQLDGFTATPAKSFDDYLGRTVLIEFFAYW